MVHKDHVFLLEKATINKNEIWADLGSGWGAFTLALRDLGSKDIEIYSIDKNQHSLKEQKQNFKNQFPDSNIKFINQDFTDQLNIPKLDGILMANSLHYVKDLVSFLKNIKSYLKPGGKLLIVEYNSDQANTWVPYPLSFGTLSSICVEAGFNTPRFLDRLGSEFLNEIYSAESLAY